MSSSTVGPIRTFKTATDLSAKQFYIVQLSAKETVALASAATQVLLGALQNEPVANENAVVVMPHGGGTAKVIAGGAITRGAALTADAAGKAVATTTVGDFIIGHAVEATTNGANDIIEYTPGGHNRYAATA